MNTIMTSKISSLSSLACLWLAMAGCGAIEDGAIHEQDEPNLVETDQALLDFCTHVTGDAQLGPSAWKGQALCLKHEYLHAKTAVHYARVAFKGYCSDDRVMRVVAERQYLGVWTQLWKKDVPMVQQASSVTCSASYTSPSIVNSALTTGTKLRFSLALDPLLPNAFPTMESIVTPQ
jgi:hypothetical protein